MSTSHDKKPLAQVLGEEDHAPAAICVGDTVFEPAEITSLPEARAFVDAINAAVESREAKLRADNLRMRRALWSIAACHYGDEARALVKAQGLAVTHGDENGWCDGGCMDVAEAALGEFNPMNPPTD